MKKILVIAFAAFAVLSFFSAKAQDNERALVINAGNVKHLILGNNLKIVLLEHNTGSQDVKFSKAVDNLLKVSMHSGMMSVHAQFKFDGSEPVYILVDDVRSLSLGENTRIDTEGVLNSERIDVFVEQGAKAFLRTTGKVNASSLGDFDVSVERNSIGVSKVF